MANGMGFTPSPVAVVTAMGNISAAASAFGLYDRGLIRPGMAADLTIFNADTVQSLPEDVVHDFPNNGWRLRERAQGIEYTVVNGTVLMEQGEPSGALPGRVL
jgi:N-acyl-D-amino-acid deacylase